MKLKLKSKEMKWEKYKKKTQIKKSNLKFNLHKLLTLLNLINQTLWKMHFLKVLLFREKIKPKK